MSFGIPTNARIQSFTAECCYKCYSFQLSLLAVADGVDGSLVAGCGSTNDVCWFVTSLRIVASVPSPQRQNDIRSLRAAAGAPSELLRTTWTLIKRQVAPNSAKIPCRTTSAASREGETQATLLFCRAWKQRKHENPLWKDIMKAHTRAGIGFVFSL